MAQNSGCGFLMGFLLVAFPVIALIFGSDEPAMQTDNAALVMTGMIFFGIIMMASNSSKRKTTVSTPIQTQRRQVMTQARMAVVNPQPSSTMTHGSIPGREVITKILVICPYCGAKNEQGVLKCQNCCAEL